MSTEPDPVAPMSAPSTGPVPPTGYRPAEPAADAGPDVRTASDSRRGIQADESDPAGAHVERVSTRTGPTRPRRHRWLVGLPAWCGVWTLGAIAWAAVALFAPAGDGPREAVQRKAGVHHDQHETAGRYYIPTYAEVEKDGTAVLRYEVGDSQDSNVEDFLRTYDIYDTPPSRSAPARPR